MNRTQVNAVSSAIMRLIEANQENEPALQGFIVRKGSGSFDHEGLRMKLEISEKPTTDIEEQLAEQDPQSVGVGLARVNTLVFCRLIGGENQKGRIVKAARTRYHIEGIGGKYDGRIFTYPFSGTKLTKTEAVH